MMRKLIFLWFFGQGIDRRVGCHEAKLTGNGCIRYYLMLHKMASRVAQDGILCMTFFYLSGTGIGEVG